MTQQPISTDPTYLAWLAERAADVPEPVISVKGFIFSIELAGERVVTSYDYERLALAIAGQWDRRNN